MNAFKGSLSASEACTLVAQGFRQGFPEARVVEIPLADGGDGTIDVLVAARGGNVQHVEVAGPYNEPVYSKVGLLPGGTAVIESAGCSGLALAPPGERNVFAATSYGVGELMVWAARHGAGRIVVGIGGTAMNDGGIGMVQAAGGRVLDKAGRQVAQGIYGLQQASHVELGDIPANFQDIEVIAICDVENPLAGPEGATRVYGPQKGIKVCQLREVDDYMDRYGSILGRDLGRDPRLVPRAGAGGGLAAALWAFVGAKLRDGANFILEEAGCIDEIAGAGIIVTGEGKVDSQTEKGKVPYAVAKAGSKHGVPVVVLGGSLGDSVIHGYPAEFCSVFDSTTGPGTIEEAIERTRLTLPFAARQIAGLSRAMLLRSPARRELSAGGVVIRSNFGKLQVLMIEDRFGFLALPKGHVDQGESFEQAALREVKEETGIECKLIARTGSHTYRFLDSCCSPVEKTVHYYVMKQAGGEIRPQPGESAEVMWVGEESVNSIKTYPNVKEVIGQSLAIYAKLAQKQT